MNWQPWPGQPSPTFPICMAECGPSLAQLPGRRAMIRSAGLAWAGMARLTQRVVLALQTSKAPRAQLAFETV